MYCEDKWQVQPGFIRHYAPCGAYYDEPIIGKGKEECNGCGYPFDIGSMNTDGATSLIQHVCDKCLSTGKIHRCHTCKKFVHEDWKFLMTSKSSVGTIQYCNDCKPPIVFTYNIIPGSRKAKIAIPTNREMGIKYSYFYDELSFLLKVPAEKILINGETRPNDRVMMCPAEHLTDRSRIFDVTILD